MSEQIKPNPKWSVMYEVAIRPDGSLLFPERLTTEFLNEARKKMGSMLFANQYLNEIFPAEDAKFKKEWFKYLHLLPSNLYTFAFIDPAIGQKKTNDYTGIVVVSVDDKTNWYVRHASRTRLTPTQIVSKVFEIQKEFKCQVIGIENYAFQEALLFMLDEKMRELKTMLPVTGINKGTQISKETHILSLVPMFEWGRIYFASLFDDLERELLQFPRSAHDDIADALSNIQNIVYYPQPIKEDFNSVKHNPHDPRYESYIIRQYASRANQEG